MIHFLTLPEVLDLYHSIVVQSGGAFGLRSNDALESALAQPKMTFGGTYLYPTLAEKAALGFSLIMNHPFVDGNKRIGHAAMETFLVLNGFEINATVDEQEKIILQVASGVVNRQEFTNWLKVHLVQTTNL